MSGIYFGLGLCRGHDGDALKRVGGHPDFIIKA